MPLVAKLFDTEPSAHAIADLVQKAVASDEPHQHLISDRGIQFTAYRFRQTLRRLGIRQRFGAIGKAGSIALIERLWKTLKNMLSLRSRPSLTRYDLEHRLTLGLFYYAYLRPHQGLGGATPAEVYFGLRPAHRSAVAPPRGCPGKGLTDSSFEITYLDTDQHLPFLRRKVA